MNGPFGNPMAWSFLCSWGSITKHKTSHKSRQDHRGEVRFVVGRDRLKVRRTPDFQGHSCVRVFLRVLELCEKCSGHVGEGVIYFRAGQTAVKVEMERSSWVCARRPHIEGREKKELNILLHWQVCLSSTINARCYAMSYQLMQVYHIVWPHKCVNMWICKVALPPFFHDDAFAYKTQPQYATSPRQL